MKGAFDVGRIEAPHPGIERRGVAQPSGEQVLHHGQALD
ncbi:Uncharacterised protein [Bordetella pertussis]|nr:Uncharacterised protein [Bordetella pertussis]